MKLDGLVMDEVVMDEVKVNGRIKAMVGGII